MCYTVCFFAVYGFEGAGLDSSSCGGATGAAESSAMDKARRRHDASSDVHLEAAEEERREAPAAKDVGSRGPHAHDCVSR